MLGNAFNRCWDIFYWTSVNFDLLVALEKTLQDHQNQ